MERSSGGGFWATISKFVEDAGVACGSDQSNKSSTSIDFGKIFENVTHISNQSNKSSTTSISDFEKFFENPNGAGVSYPEGDLEGFPGSSCHYRNCWGEWHSQRLIAGRIDLLPEEDKARFYLVLGCKAWERVFSPVLTGLLTKNSEGGLSCSVLVEEWQEPKPIYDCVKHLLDSHGRLDQGSGYYVISDFLRKLKPVSFLEHTRSEILYLDPPGSFDCEALERDALTLKVLTAKLLIHGSKKPESYAEQCAAEADRLAEELKQDCHKRMENFATAQEGGAKPKRTIQEELSYLKEIDAWQTAVAKIARTQNSFPEIDMNLFPPLSDTSFGFLMDSSLIKKRMQLSVKVADYVSKTASHPLNFS